MQHAEGFLDNYNYCGISDEKLQEWNFGRTSPEKFKLYNSYWHSEK